MEKKVEIKLIQSQQEFLKHKDDLVYAYLAGQGTGKSFAAALWTMYRVYDLGESIFVGSQTWSTTYGVQFKALTDLFEMLGLVEDRDYSFNKANLEITFHNRPGRIKGCCSAAKKSIEGYTKFNGCWLDEASNWDEEVKNYVISRCRGCKDKDGKLSDARIRFTGTPPLEPSGWYFSWLKKNPGKYVCASTKEAVGKYLSESYYRQLVDAWGGEGSPLTLIMVHGQLPDENSSASIFRREHNPVSIPVSMGIDCSGGNGGDEAYFTVTNGINILEEVQMKDFTQKELLAKAMELSDKWKVEERRLDNTGGYGIFLLEALNDNGYPTTGINFGQAAVDSKSYLNARAEMYYNAATRWNDSWGDKYQTERYATVFTTNSSGKLQLIPKEQIKKIIGYSPDGLDSLCLALYTNCNKEFVPDNEQLSSVLDLFSA